jgi:tetratricopeptide (TPR) repeat protein
MLRIRVAQSDDLVRTLTVHAPSETPEVLFFKGAVATMRLTDPYVLASYYYELQMDAGTTDFAATRRELEYAIARMTPDTSAWLYNLWVLTLLAEDEPDAAITEFRRALAFDPLFVLAIHNWGTALASQGRYREAMAKFRRVVEIDGEQIRSARAFAELAAAHAALGQHEDAANLIQRSLANDPRGDRAYYRWAQFMEDAGRYEEARELYRLALLFKSYSRKWVMD